MNSGAPLGSWGNTGDGTSRMEVDEPKHTPKATNMRTVSFKLDIPPLSSSRDPSISPTSPRMTGRPTGLSMRSLPALPALPIDGQNTPTEPSTLFNAGRLTFPGDPNNYNFRSEDLIDLGEIGRGNFGSVNRMRHKDSGREMAVKRIRSYTVSTGEQLSMLRELRIVIEAQGCDSIVRFYGAIFYEGDCWICMELMDVSMDMVYQEATRQGIKFSERFIWRLAIDMVNALEYLRTQLRMIHRDVKPSNILLNRTGYFKLCDFGIAGKLVDSIAKTQDAGCRPYMAPERVSNMNSPYGTRSDVWSLGISFYEIVTGRFPYRAWSSPFEQLSQVVEGPAPVIGLQDVQNTDYSRLMLDFINQCLVKDVGHRPKYDQLKQHPFYPRYADIPEADIRGEVGAVVSALLETMPAYSLKEDKA